MRGYCTANEISVFFSSDRFDFFFWHNLVCDLDFQRIAELLCFVSRDFNHYGAINLLKEMSEVLESVRGVGSRVAQARSFAVQNSVIRIRHKEDARLKDAQIFKGSFFEGFQGSKCRDWFISPTLSRVAGIANTWIYLSIRHQIKNDPLFFFSSSFLPRSYIYEREPLTIFDRIFVVIICL